MSRENVFLLLTAGFLMFSFVCVTCPPLSLFWTMFVFSFAGFARPSWWEGREWRRRSNGECSSLSLSLWLFSSVAAIHIVFTYNPERCWLLWSFGSWLSLATPPATWHISWSLWKMYRHTFLLVKTLHARFPCSMFYLLAFINVSVQLD